MDANGHNWHSNEFIGTYCDRCGCSMSNLLPSKASEEPCPGRKPVDECERLRAEVGRLRTGIQNFIDGDWGVRYGKIDKCPHDRYGYEDCGNCADEYFFELLKAQ